MAIDFFNNRCQQATSEKIFGLCDEEGTQKPAYIDISNQDNWIAEIENEDQKEVYFIAIDNCIEIWRDDDPTKMEKRCDGMLGYDGNNLIFVELKDRKLKNAVMESVKDIFKEYGFIVEFEISHESNSKKIKVCDIKSEEIKHLKNNGLVTTRNSEDLCELIKVMLEYKKS